MATEFEQPGDLPLRSIGVKALRCWRSISTRLRPLTISSGFRSRSNIRTPPIGERCETGCTLTIRPMLSVRARFAQLKPRFRNSVGFMCRRK